MTFEEFKRHFGFNKIDHAVVHETINRYVEHKLLGSKNWSMIEAPVRELLAILCGDGSLLYLLLYAICKEELQFIDEVRRIKRQSKKASEKRIFNRSQIFQRLRRREQRKIKRELINFLNNLDNVIAYMDTYIYAKDGSIQGKGNPLSGYSEKILFHDLKRYRNARKQIETLNAKDRGKYARYQMHPDGTYDKRSAEIQDHVTRLLLYVELHMRREGTHTSEETLNNIAEVFNYFGFDQADDTVGLVKIFKDRLRTYKNKKIGVFKNGWNINLIPPIGIHK
jgi:hypothetical protein